MLLFLQWPGKEVAQSEKIRKPNIRWECRSKECEETVAVDWIRGSLLEGLGGKASKVSRRGFEGV